MPSRAYTSFLQRDLLKRREPVTECVNALSGLYLISTKRKKISPDYLNCVNALSGLYLISTPIRVNNRSYCDGGVNALSGLYLISTGDYWGVKAGVAWVSMPSRAYTSFLRNLIARLGEEE